MTDDTEYFSPSQAEVEIQTPTMGFRWYKVGKTKVLQQMFEAITYIHGVPYSRNEVWKEVPTVNE